MKAYLLYFSGVILLALPAGFLTHKYFKVATLADLTDSARQRLGWLHPLNLVDLARAYAGMSLLLAGFVVHEPAAPSHLVTRIVLAIAALLGLGMQHVFHRTKDDQLAAPIAFAFGLALALLPLKVALLSLPLGIATAIAVRNLAAGLVFSALATAILGHLFGTDLVALGTATLLLFLPAFIAALLHRSLVLTVRRGPILRYATLRDVSLPNTR